MCCVTGVPNHVYSSIIAIFRRNSKRSSICYAVKYTFAKWEDANEWIRVKIWDAFPRCLQYLFSLTTIDIFRTFSGSVATNTVIAVQSNLRINLARLCANRCEVVPLNVNEMRSGNCHPKRWTSVVVMATEFHPKWTRAQIEKGAYYRFGTARGDFRRIQHGIPPVCIITAPGEGYVIGWIPQRHVTCNLINSFRTVGIFNEEHCVQRVRLQIRTSS